MTKKPLQPTYTECTKTLNYTPPITEIRKSQYRGRWGWRGKRREEGDSQLVAMHLVRLGQSTRGARSDLRSDQREDV